MSDLHQRIEAFDHITHRFTCRRPHPLIAIYTMSPTEWDRLVKAAAIYLSRNCPGRMIETDGEALVQRYLENWASIPNITPNGMIVPKRHNVLEYNALVRAFAETVAALDFEDYILSWHVPLNLRIKRGSADPENLKRHHPTEHIHSDSWAGESSESATVHIPLFGDTAKNRLEFYVPPDDFDDEWLKPLPSYEAGKEFAKKFTKIDCEVKKGEIVIADFGTLHTSSRFPGAGTRISIDTTFALRKPSFTGQEKIHPWRSEERAPHSTLLGLGTSHLFYFPDDAHKQVDSLAGFKHASTLKIIELG